MAISGSGFQEGVYSYLQMGEDGAILTNELITFRPVIYFHFLTFCFKMICDQFCCLHVFVQFVTKLAIVEFSEVKKKCKVRILCKKWVIGSENGCEGHSISITTLSHTSWLLMQFSWVGRYHHPYRSPMGMWLIS